MFYVAALSKTLVLICLVAIPYAVYRWAKANWPTRTGVLTGASVGLVVTPVSHGIHFLGYLLPFIGMLLGLIGGALWLFHGAPGYQLSLVFGFQEPGVVVQGFGSIWVEVLSSLFWSLVYAIVGFILDKKFLRYAPVT